MSHIPWDEAHGLFKYEWMIRKSNICFYVTENPKLYSLNKPSPERVRWRFYLEFY